MFRRALGGYAFLGIRRAEPPGVSDSNRLHLSEFLAGHLSAGSADTTRSSQFGIIAEACVPLFTVMFVPRPKHTSTTFFVSPLCSPPNGIDSLVSPRRALNLGLATSIRHLQHRGQANYAYLVRKSFVVRCMAEPRNALWSVASCKSQ